MPENYIKTKEIEQALHSGEFCFFYQPKISFLSGGIVGGEALLRWIKPSGEIVPPNDFLPQAESSGFITDITAVMLHQLIDDIETIRVIRPDIQAAFNVSALDLHSPYLVKMLRAFTGSHRIDPGNIQIEITETAVVEASDRILASLVDLVSLGIEIVMDDYGTGYSSLDVLSQLPFSALKLDQGVVRRMAEESKNTHIVRASLSMARELSMKVVAEGVESQATYVFLMASGCDSAQGYWISRPIPLPDFTSMLDQSPTWPSSSLGLLYNAWFNHNSYRQKVLDTVYTLMLTDEGEWNDLPKTDLVHSPARCRLGRWYLGEEGPAGNKESPLSRLENSHRLMHAAGETLVRAAQRKKGAGDVMEAMNNFMEYSDVIDSEISRIVQRWLGQTLDGRDKEAGDQMDAEQITRATALDLAGS